MNKPPCVLYTSECCLTGDLFPRYVSVPAFKGSWGFLKGPNQQLHYQQNLSSNACTKIVFKSTCLIVTLALFNVQNLSVTYLQYGSADSRLRNLCLSHYVASLYGNLCFTHFLEFSVIKPNDV